MEWSRTRLDKCKYVFAGYDPARLTVGFDFDGTLAPCKGRGPPAAIGAALVGRLAELFNVVIITNNPKLDEIEAFFALLPGGAAVSVFAAVGASRYRKPQVGAWDLYVENARRHCGGGWNLPPPRVLFYCGDAAGRRGDFAASDAQFAANIGVRFEPAEAFFGPGASGWYGVPPPLLEDAPPPELPGLPEALFETDDAPRRALAALIAAQGARPVCVVMVGSPGAGKSYLAEALSNETERPSEFIGNDAARLRMSYKPDTPFAARIKNRAADIYVDNTHPDRESRARAFEMVRAVGVDYYLVVCHVTTPKDACMYLAALRVHMHGPCVPAVAIHAYWKRFEAPTAEEVAGTYGAYLATVPFARSPTAAPFTMAF
jgi:chloramphenicol 3-O-phosphotransferase